MAENSDKKTQWHENEENFQPKSSNPDQIAEAQKKHHAWCLENGMMIGSACRLN